MEWNRWDICEAWYCFAREWHGGKFTREYAILGRLALMEFRPRQPLNRETLTPNGLAIYEALVWGKTGLKPRGRLKAFEPTKPRETNTRYGWAEL